MAHTREFQRRHWNGQGQILIVCFAHELNELFKLYMW